MSGKTMHRIQDILRYCKVILDCDFSFTPALGGCMIDIACIAKVQLAMIVSSHDFGGT